MPATGSNTSIGDTSPLSVTEQRHGDFPCAFDLSQNLRWYFVHQRDFQNAVLEPTKNTLRKAFDFIRQSRMLGQVEFGEEAPLIEILMELSSTWLLMTFILDEDIAPIQLPNFALQSSDQTKEKTYSEAIYSVIEENTELQHIARVLCWLQLELRKDLYMEELKRDKTLLITKERRQEVVLTTDSLEADNGAPSPSKDLNKRVRLNTYSCEDLYYHCGRLASAGFFSSAENLFVASQQGHLACSLFSNGIPHFNLLYEEGRDVYQHCLPEMLAFTASTPRENENGVINVRRVANILNSTKQKEQFYGLECGTRSDSQFGFGTQSATINLAAYTKAKNADKPGMFHEYEYYSFICGRKQPSQSLFNRNWHSHLYSHFYFHLRQKVDYQLQKHTQPNEDLMDLDKAVTSSTKMKCYTQGKDIQSGKGWCRNQAEGSNHHEHILIQALSLHRPESSVQQFFRTLQSALILKQHTNLLTEFEAKLRNLVATTKPGLPETIEEAMKQIWLITFVDILIALINKGELKKLDLTKLQLRLFDDMVSCVLEILCHQEQIDLIPMYACHLQVPNQIEWYQRALRSGMFSEEESAKNWLLEAKYWLEEWPGFEYESFQRTDDEESYEATMEEVVYWNALEICKDLSKGLKDRKRALWWLGIALNQQPQEQKQHQEDTKIHHLARDLYFTLFLETSFLNLTSAIEMHSFIPDNLIGKTQVQTQGMKMLDQVSCTDLGNWLHYCLLEVDVTVFLETAVSCGFQLDDNITLMDPNHQETTMQRFREKLKSEHQQDPYKYLARGKQLYDRIVKTVTSDFFYEALILNPSVEKHKIEFVVCKGLASDKSFIPFSSVDIASATECIEAFLNDILACHEHNAAASSFGSPLPGFVTIRMEFKKEALSLNNYMLLSLLIRFLKGQYRNTVSSMVTALFSSPLPISKCIANTQTKSAMLRDMKKIHKVIRHLEYTLDGNITIAHPFGLLTERRSQLFFEEHVMNETEALDWLKEDANLKIEDYILLNHVKRIL